jgi:trehalose utilization protein
MARKKGCSNSKLLAFLKEIGEKIPEEVNNIYINGGNTILADAKSRIKSKSGKLAESGHLKQSGNKQLRKVQVVFDAEADRKGQPYKYGRIVEFRPGHEHPFLYPAYDAHSDKIREDALETIRDVVKKVDIS